jgi:tripartite-type tricarboxylate transporter receptor subunit TctC
MNMCNIVKLMRSAAAFVLCALVLAAAGSPAVAWPDRNVRFLVPIGPGAGVDITARLFSDRLAKKWGQSVVVENRPGGDAIVAITAFITANDDHTLLFGPSGSFTAHPYTQQKVPYDVKELSTIARVTSTIVVVAVPASSNIKSVADLEAAARAAPGKLNWATATGLNDLLFAGYLKGSGLEMTKVPYRDTVSAINDLAEARLDVYVGAYAIVRPQAQAGKVRILVVTNRERAASVPDIPTAREAGSPGLEYDGLTGLFGPRSMPNDVRARIAADVKATATDPEVAQRLTATGQIIIPGTAEEFAAAIEQQRRQVEAIGKVLGVKPATQ